MGVAANLYLRADFGLQRGFQTFHIPRPVPVLGVLMCLLMALPLLIDIVLKARAGNPIPAYLLGSYCALGALLYIAYGFQHSRLNIAIPRES